MYRRCWTIGLFAMAGLFSLALMEAPAQEKKAQKPKEVWTDPNDSTLPPDFKIQGEYVGDKLGCQVIALGKGQFQAVVLDGGLPGDGWDGKSKILLHGELTTSGGAAFTPATGKRKYLAQKPLEFSATSSYPTKAQKDYTATVAGEVMIVKTDEGKSLELKKTARKSPTLGAKAPSGATILYDGADTAHWTRGRIDKDTGTLNTDGNDIVSKAKFHDYTAHLEFFLPYRPDARGQGRGNSGFYMVQQYEVQILDSFGLDGKNNEAGGIYTRLDPKVNMCYPPLTWQTYDIDFTNAVREGDKKVKNARITIRHNGVLIHEDREITGPTGGGRDAKFEGTPGPFVLQGHGNPLQFRNIWVVEKK